MVFQASKFKERKFLELNDDNSSPIHPIYSKDRAWLKYFGFLNSLCAWVTRLVTNHIPISEYRLRFFSKESIACPYSDYPIETRRHILFKCPQYRKSWNPKRESLKDINFARVQSWSVLLPGVHNIKKKNFFSFVLSK